MVRRLASWGLALAVLLVGLPVAAAPASASPSLETELACAVNAHRQRLGTSTLRVNAELTRVARQQAVRMADSGHLHHTPNLGSRVSGWTRLTENVGRGPSIPRIHGGLLDSSGHRRNIEDGAVTEVGVGVVTRGSTVWAVQVFRQPRGSTSGAAPTCPTSPAVVPIPLSGDWNGDGRTTPGWRVGDRFVLRNANSAGTASVSFRFGRAGDVPVVGDWNGNGRTTVGVFRPGGRWLLRNANSSGPSHHDFRFGRAGGAVPFVGDWNRNGRDTVAVRYHGGRWLLRNSLSAGSADHRFTFGRRSDAVGVVGDWNGNGRTTVGAWHPGGRWLLRNRHSSGSSDHAFTFGRASAAAPVTGDWNRSGRTTGAVVRTDDRWLLRNRHAAGSADRSFTFSAR